MSRALLLACAALLLGACRESVADRPGPVEMTAEAVGFYCQMALLDHEGPKGQIHLDGMPAPIFFAQVKDAVAYLHMPEQGHAILASYVQDMGGAGDWAHPGPWIPVEEALYVVGSNRMGGMGAPEFVPFSTEIQAREFAAIHGGTLRSFAEIGDADVLAAIADDKGNATDDMASRLGALTQHTGSN